MTTGNNQQFIKRILTSIWTVSIVSLLVAVAIFLGNGLNLVGWGFIVQIRYYLLLAIACWLFYTLYFIQYRKRYITFKYYTLFLSIWPLSTIFTSVIIGGNLIEEIQHIPTWVFVATFFLIFHHFKLSEKQIIWILLIVASITVTIQILQQVEPMFAIFGGSPDDTGEIVITGERNGLARYFVGSYQVQMFAMCFCWCKMLRTFHPHWIILSGLMIVSIYLYLTKQILITSLFTLGLSFFLVKGRVVRILAYIFLCFCIIALAVFWEDLFGEMIQDSKDSSFSYAIRFEFIGYIMEYNITDPFGVIFGHGTTISWFEELRHMLYYPSDIGFFGEAIYYGWPWAFAYFFVVFRILVTYRNRVPLYIRLYLICSGLISIFIFPYRDRMELFNWICVIYISSIYIDKKICYTLSSSHHTKDSISEKP